MFDWLLGHYRSKKETHNLYVYSVDRYGKPRTFVLIKRTAEYIASLLEPQEDDHPKRETIIKYSEFNPSHQDLHAIIQAIAGLEDYKYPHGQGRKMLRDFLRDTVDGLPYEELAIKYKLPK